MTIRVTCDGCDRELDAETHHKGIVASRAANAYAGMHGREFDLCPDCVATFNNAFNPFLWPRTVKIKA